MLKITIISFSAETPPFSEKLIVTRANNPGFSTLSSFFSQSKNKLGAHSSPAFIFCKWHWGFRETKGKVRAIKGNSPSWCLHCHTHCLAACKQRPGSKWKTICAAEKLLVNSNSEGALVSSRLRWHEGWCVGVVYMRGSAYGWPAEVEGTFIWVCLIDMLGSMGEQKAFLQSTPIQTRSPGPPHAGARHPISHNHSTELKDTSSPPPSPHHLNTHTDGNTQRWGKQTPNNHHRHTYAHRQSNTQNPYWSSPPCCTRGPTLFWGREEGGQHSRRVPDDLLIPPWTIGSHSVVSTGGLVMCHSWLLCYHTSLNHELPNYPINNVDIYI